MKPPKTFKSEAHLILKCTPSSFGQDNKISKNASALLVQSDDFKRYL